MSARQQRNTICYCMQLVVTSMGLVMTVLLGRDLLVEGRLIVAEIEDNPRSFQQNMDSMQMIIGFIAQPIIALYTFEIFYRPKMRVPLLLHHLATIFAVLMGVCSYNDTKNT